MDISKFSDERDRLTRRNKQLELFLEAINIDIPVNVCTTERFRDGRPAGSNSSLFIALPAKSIMDAAREEVERNIVRLEHLQKVIDVAEAAMRDFDTTE